MVCTQRRLFGLCLLAMVLLSGVPLSGSLALAQTTLQGTVVQDTFVMRPYPDNLNGFDATFGVGNDSGWRYDLLMQFELPEAPEGLVLQSASLELFNWVLEWANRGNAEFGVKAAMFDWSEQNATWASTSADGDQEPPPYGDVVYGVEQFMGIDPPDPTTRADLNPDEWKTWEIKELVQAWYDGSIENQGLVILGMENAVPGSGGASLFPFFYTKEEADDTVRPVLSLVFDEGGIVLPGDVNLDGEVNGLDVDPFVGLVTSGNFQAEGDMNEDGVVNGLDVDPFVEAVVGGGVQAVPEPSTCALLLLGLASAGLCCRRQSSS